MALPLAASPGAASPFMPSWPPTLDGRGWSYRRLDTWSVLADERAWSCRRSGRAAPRWLGERALVQGKLGIPATTAQVHPGRFTEAMLQAAIDLGARAPARKRDRPRAGPWQAAPLWASRSTVGGSRPTHW